jgi:hypothetical protein
LLTEKVIKLVSKFSSIKFGGLIVCLRVVIERLSEPENVPELSLLATCPLPPQV